MTHETDREIVEGDGKHTQEPASKGRGRTRGAAAGVGSARKDHATHAQSQSWN